MNSSIPNDLPTKGSITLGLGIIIWYWGDTNIQSTAERSLGWGGKVDRSLDSVPSLKDRCVGSQMSWTRSQQTFPVKDQSVNFLAFAGHVVSVTTQLCYHSGKAVIDDP